MRCSSTSPDNYVTDGKTGLEIQRSLWFVCMVTDKLPLWLHNPCMAASSVSVVCMNCTSG